MNFCADDASKHTTRELCSSSAMLFIAIKQINNRKAVLSKRTIVSLHWNGELEIGTQMSTMQKVQMNLSRAFTIQQSVN